MPLAIALLGSIAIHLGALFATEWELPGLSEHESPPVVDAVLLPLPAPSVPVSLTKKSPPAKPVPRKNTGSLPDTAASNVATSTDTAVSSSPTLVPDAAKVPEPVPPASPPPPAPPPINLAAKGRLHYSVIRGEQGFVVGQSVHEWEHDGKNYRIRSVTETTGLAAIFKPARVVQTSQGLIDSAGLQPVEFRHEKVKGVDSATFDWTTRKVRYEDKEVFLPDGAQDMLSLYYQAALMVAPEQRVEFAVATGRKLERYRFEPKGEEKLSFAGKNWPVLRIAAKSGPDVIELWIAPELRNLPLKIRFVDNKGEIFDQIAETMDIKETQ